MSRWLEDEHLVRDGSSTNWKRQYKLRHNWSCGSARITETEVAEQPSIPPLLVRLHDEAVIVVDAEHGLRAWSLKGEDRLLAIADWSTGSNGESKCPTSMAIDISTSSKGLTNISVGFTDGSFSIYTLYRVAKKFVQRYTHASSSNGSLSAMAYSSPYLLTMTSGPRLSLYCFNQSSDIDSSTVLLAPKLISSLKSHTAYPPLSLALRISASYITASIAYAMPCWTSWWSVGLQELRVALDGTILDSRIASAPTRRGIKSSNWTNLSSAQEHRNTVDQISSDEGFGILSAPSCRPTSLSYNHPYLLTSHPDNTLTLYMVTSTGKSLVIGPGRRLWGHTSSISGAHVGDRGKAVSVTTQGNELRVWELEGQGPLPGTRRPANFEQVSVQVHSAGDINGASGGAWEVSRRYEEVTKGWIAFDEEKVVLLREKMHGAQALVMYDFT